MDEKVVYTSSGLKINLEKIKELPVIGIGSHGTIHDYGDGKVIKVLRKPIDLCDYYTVEKIKNLDLQSYYHIYDILSAKLSSKEYLGMITSFHESEDVDIWTMSSDWVLEKFQRIYEDAIKLGENGILLKDIGPHNSVLNKDGITMIDVDNYSNLGSSCVSKNLGKINKDLFYYLLLQSFNFYHSVLKGLIPIDDILTDIFFDDSLNGENNDFVKALKKYPKPIFYLIDQIGK